MTSIACHRNPLAAWECKVMCGIRQFTIRRTARVSEAETRSPASLKSCWPRVGFTFLHHSAITDLRSVIKSRGNDPEKVHDISTDLPLCGSERFTDDT